MRVGIIVRLIPDRKFGFIRSEHFRDDVFFHYSVLKGLPSQYLDEGQEVEFEINEILRLDEKRLDATLVQAASRPLSKSLDEKTIPEMQAAHHPKARQRKPIWREKTSNAYPAKPGESSTESSAESIQEPQSED
ncbi:MAG: cold shock domain-containing protein [Pirellula sp.]